MSIGIYNIDDYINNTEIDFNEKKNEFIRKLIRDYSKGDVYDKVVQALSKDYKEYDLEISHESSLIDYNFLKK